MTQAWKVRWPWPGRKGHPHQTHLVPASSHLYTQKESRLGCDRRGTGQVGAGSDSWGGAYGRSGALCGQERGLSPRQEGGMAGASTPGSAPWPRARMVQLQGQGERVWGCGLHALALHTQVPCSVRHRWEPWIVFKSGSQRPIDETQPGWCLASLCGSGGRVVGRKGNDHLLSVPRYWALNKAGRYPRHPSASSQWAAVPVDLEQSSPEAPESPRTMPPYLSITSHMRCA